MEHGAIKPLEIKMLQPQDFPGGPVLKNLPASAGDASAIPGPERVLIPPLAATKVTTTHVYAQQGKPRAAIN